MPLTQDNETNEIILIGVKIFVEKKCDDSFKCVNNMQWIPKQTYTLNFVFGIEICLLLRCEFRILNGAVCKYTK